MYNQALGNFSNQEHVMFQSPPITTNTVMANQNIPENASSSLYLIKKNPTPPLLTGSTNLLSHFGLDVTYNKFNSGKKVKENLSSFLSDLPGCIDTAGMEDGSSLQAIIEKPPIIGSKEIQPLSQGLLASFRLHPGPIPERYMALHHPVDSRRKSKHRNKHKLDITLDGDEVEHRKMKKKKHEDGEKKRKKKDKKKKRDSKMKM